MGELRETGDIVDDAVREVGCGSDKQHGVGIDEAGDGGEGDPIGRCFASHQVDLDLEVFAGFAEGGVGSLREDHLGFGDDALVVGLVAGRKTGHEDRLSTSARGDAYRT